MRQFNVAMIFDYNIITCDNDEGDSNNTLFSIRRSTYLSMASVNNISWYPENDEHYEKIMNAGLLLSHLLFSSSFSSFVLFEKIIW